VLDDFLFKNRAAIIARAREKVPASPAPRAADAESDNGIPLFLDQLIATLRSNATSREVLAESAATHGRLLLKKGFTVAQVVHDYGGVCQAVTELAGELNSPITAEEFHTFNAALDEAIAQAVTEYGRTREQSITDERTERLGNLAHELRNALGAAMLSFQTMKMGRVGVGGSTSALLGRSLRTLARLIDSSAAQQRLESESLTIERVSVHQFIEEIEVAASMEASARDLVLDVTTIAPEVDVAADRDLLAGALTNLLQNAFKYTRPRGRVSLKTSASDRRVVIEVEDECGGLPPGKAEELFRPFEQRSSDRTGLGLGLSISRRSVKALGGELRVRDLPGSGCVFTIDLPRA